MKHNPITAIAILSGIAVLLVLCFIFGNLRDLLLGSPLSIHTVSDGTTLSNGFLPISGNARHARNVSINGRAVLIDRSGNFADGVLLSPGYNVIEVALKDQFGKQKVKTYHVVLNAADTVATAGTPDQNF